MITDAVCEEVAHGGYVCACARACVNEYGGRGICGTRPFTTVIQLASL